MSYNPGLKIGDVITNDQLHECFGGRKMSGMRYNKTAGVQVLVADYTNDTYLDKWFGDVLQLTGTGQIGDQTLSDQYNRRVAESGSNGIELHLFQVFKTTEYTYCGVVTLDDAPYTETQPDKNGNDRLVYVFPIRPESPKVPKPAHLVFEDREDYANRRVAAERAFVRSRSGWKGTRVKHKEYGTGVIMKEQGNLVEVLYDKGAERNKEYNWDLAMKSGYFEILD